MNLKIKQLYSSAWEEKGPGNKALTPTDIIAIMDNGQKYLAAFFTYQNIEEIRQKNQQRGDNLNGTYFWNKNMVLVEDGSLDTIRKVVEDMIEEGVFLEVFEKM